MQQRVVFVHVFWHYTHLHEPFHIDCNPLLCLMLICYNAITLLLSFLATISFLPLQAAYEASLYPCEGAWTAWLV